MAGVADEVEAALAAAHLDDLDERDEDFQAHDAGVALDDLDAVKEAIRKQVEFYFSDANLPTDKHLIKQIQKDPEGYVPVKALANFKRVKALSKDLDVVVAALAASTLLQVQVDTKRVRRLAPLPEVDTADIERRTLLVEHLPTTPTIESVTQLFAKHGEVRMVRICAQGSKHKLPAWLTTAVAKMVVGSQQYALVEFCSEEEAVKAVAAYKDLDNWRTSLRVRHLRAPKQTSRPSSRSEHHSSTGHRLSDGRGHGSHSSSGNHPKSNSGSRRGSHDGAHKGDDLPSLPPVKTSLDGRARHTPHHSHLGHGEGHAAAAAAAAGAISGGSRPMSPYGGSSRSTPPLSPAAGAAGAAAAAAVAAAMRPSTPSGGGAGSGGGGMHTPGVSPRPAAASNSEVSALIDRILSTPTSGANTPTPGTPLGGLGSPKRPSGIPGFAGFSTPGSQSGSPHRGASTPTRVSGAAAAAGGSSGSSGGASTLPVGVAPATAAAAAAAAAAAMAGSPKSSNSNSWRPFGTSASAPVTPLSGTVGSLTPEPADPKKPGPWVPAHRLAHMASGSGTASDAEAGSSSSGGALLGSIGRPPRHRRSSGVESDGYARSDGGDSSDGGMSGARRSGRTMLAHRTGRSLQSTIEAIREASCELDPAVAAKAIATLSGTASAAAAGEAAEEAAGGGSKRRQRRRSSSTARAAAAAATAAMGSANGEQGATAAGGSHGEGEQQQRAGRQRRRSTGSRRQSLDLQGPPRAGAASPDEGKKHGSSKAGGGGGGSSGGEDSKHKQRQKKDYAAWAAATVEFRQEASRASGGGGGSSSSGGAAAGSGGAASNRAGLSPLRAAHAGEAHTDTHVRIARGPDGSRGFTMGRGRPLANPPPAV